MMERTRFSILFFIKKSKLLKNGQAPIRLRITYDSQSVEIQLKRSIEVNLWLQQKQCSKGKGREATELNFYLEALRVKLFEIYQELELKGGLITVKTIHDRFLRKDETSKTLSVVFKEHNDDCRKLIGIDYEASTIGRYDTCYKYLMEMLFKEYNKKDIYLNEVNGELIRKFDFFLKTEKKLSQNTTIRFMKCFKKVINMTIANEWLIHNPFAGIKFRETEVVKEFLTLDELKCIEEKEFKVERLGIVRDVFIFCCYTGLAYVDAYSLRPQHIVKDNKGKYWILKQRQKTDIPCNIPLLNLPMQILEKYKENETCIRKNVALPVMCNQKMNFYLKEIADFCGIHKNLTTHTARHTFATTVALGNHVSLKNVSKMLGHSNTKMTEHYAKALDPNIFDDMAEVENRLKQAGL